MTATPSSTRCSSDAPCNPSRRLLLIATAGAGGALAVGAAVPFVASLTPSERALAAGAPVEVDIDKLPKNVTVVRFYNSW